jgi:hypothetical protein
MKVRPHVGASLVMANLELRRPPWPEAGMKKIGDDRYIFGAEAATRLAGRQMPREQGKP